MLRAAWLLLDPWEVGRASRAEFIASVACPAIRAMRRGNAGCGSASSQNLFHSPSEQLVAALKASFRAATIPPAVHEHYATKGVTPLRSPLAIRQKRSLGL